MAIRTQTITDKPDDILEDTVHTRTTLKADPLTASLAVPFDGLVTNHKQVVGDRIDLEVTLFQCVATAYYLDVRLDAFTDKLVKTLTELVGEDRSSADWVVFFQKSDLYTFKRPILGAQLDKMKQWPSALLLSPYPAIKDLAGELTPLLTAGEAAVQATQAAQQALTNFDNVGAFRQYVDSSNAARTTAYAALLQLPQQNPSLQLPADYAERFFLHDTSRRGAGKPRSSADIEAELTSAKARVTKLETDLKDAQAREEAAAAAATARQAKEQELAAAKQQEKEAKQKQKALAKELGKKK